MTYTRLAGVTDVSVNETLWPIDAEVVLHDGLGSEFRMAVRVGSTDLIVPVAENAVERAGLDLGVSDWLAA